MHSILTPSNAKLLGKYVYRNPLLLVCNGQVNCDTTIGSFLPFKLIDAESKIVQYRMQILVVIKTADILGHIMLKFRMVCKFAFPSPLQDLPAA